ncbi:MAG TPA: alpha/beta hydrolase [Acidimicrobiales bacterium]|jgi:pimeloyl-ACP methyl ester carboxylesterase|nr:alpha/beta hydrolase [Acidimicrobiales bacterium]
MLPTVVLIHGSGHTSLIWDDVVPKLQAPALAVDLPGRRRRPADLTHGTIEASSAAAASDVDTAGRHRVVLVGHSSGGLLLPSLAARLGDRVCHLVFVAGLIARDGHSVSEVIAPDDPDAMLVTRDALVQRYRGTTFGGLSDGEAPVDTDLSVTEDVRTVGSIESLTLMYQPVSWQGVSPSLPRSFVRCLADPIQPRDMQARLIESAGAGEVFDVEADHTPAVSRPDELAAIVNQVAARYAVSDPSGP